MASPEKVNVAQKLDLFDERWSPKIVGELNGQQAMLVKLLGEFSWHHHEEEDELFYVVGGRFRGRSSGTATSGSRKESS